MITVELILITKYNQIIQRCDLNGDGKLDYEEFRVMLWRQKERKELEQERQEMEEEEEKKRQEELKKAEGIPNKAGSKKPKTDKNENKGGKKKKGK